MPPISKYMTVGAKVGVFVKFFGEELAKQLFPQTWKIERVRAEVLEDRNLIEAGKPFRELEIRLCDANLLW